MTHRWEERDREGMRGNVRVTGNDRGVLLVTFDPTLQVAEAVEGVLKGSCLIGQECCMHAYSVQVGNSFARGVASQPSPACFATQIAQRLRHDLQSRPPWTDADPRLLEDMVNRRAMQDQAAIHAGR